MATVKFTQNLKRHLNIASIDISGRNLAQIITSLKNQQPQLASYLVDEQSRIRKHIMVSIDGKIAQDKIHLSDLVNENSEVFFMQALSGG